MQGALGTICGGKTSDASINPSDAKSCDRTGGAHPVQPRRPMQWRRPPLHTAPLQTPSVPPPLRTPGCSPCRRSHGPRSWSNAITEHNSMHEEGCYWVPPGTNHHGWQAAAEVWPGEAHRLRRWCRIESSLSASMCWMWGTTQPKVKGLRQRQRWEGTHGCPTADPSSRSSQSLGRSVLVSPAPPNAPTLPS